MLISTTERHIRKLYRPAKKSVLVYFLSANSPELPHKSLQPFMENVDNSYEYIDKVNAQRVQCFWNKSANECPGVAGSVLLSSLDVFFFDWVSK